MEEQNQRHKPRWWQVICSTYLCLAVLSFLSVCLAFWYGASQDPSGSQDQTRTTDSAFWFSFWLAISLFFACLGWGRRIWQNANGDHSRALHWWWINSILPLLFVFTPPVFYGLFLNTGEKPETVITIYFPVYFSLWIVIATVFLVVLTEIMEKVAHQEAQNSDTPMDWRLRTLAAVCFIIAAACLLFFALPYVADFETQTTGLGEPKRYTLLMVAIVAAMLGLPYASHLIADIHRRAHPARTAASQPRVYRPGNP